MIKLRDLLNEAKNDDKYVVIAFHEKGGGFVMTKPGSKKDAEDSARSITKSSDITQQKAVKVSDARKIKGLVGKQYLNEELVNENLRSGDVSKLQKGLERILGTNVNYDINSNDAYEFYIDNAEFYIGVGDGEELGTKFAFDIYNDGATKTLASGTSDNLNDIIKQVLAAARKYKKSLLQTESVNEEFTAVSNKSGKTVVFKNKDSRDAAVKAGTHEVPEDEKGGKDEPKGDTPNMFSKDAGYDSPDAKSDSKLSLSKRGPGFDMTAASKLEDELGGGISDLTDDGVITFSFGENDKETSLYFGKEDDQFAVSVENPYGDDFGDVEYFDNEDDAIAHAKELTTKYSKELGGSSNEGRIGLMNLLRK